MLTGCSIPPPCEPQIVQYEYDFSTGQKQIEHTLTYSGQSETFDFWINNDKYADTDKGSILLYVDETIDHINMKIDVDYALCDVNDSYTQLDNEDILITIQHEEFNLSDNFVYRIEKSDFEKEIVSTVTYKGAFKTKRIIKISKDT
jgi:hypothetical protein